MSRAILPLPVRGTSYKHNICPPYRWKKTILESSYRIELAAPSSISAMQEWFHLATLALKAAILAQVFAIGLASTWGEATYLFRRPALLWKSILARNVLVPLFAILLIKAFSLESAIAITIAVLSITPVPPLLPKANLKASASTEYAVGLLVSQALLAVVLVPVTVRIMDWALSAQAQFGAGQVIDLMLSTILIPLAMGMLGSWFLPRLRGIVPMLLTLGSVLLVVGAIPLLLLAWRTFGDLAGDGAILALAIFSIAGMAVGHFLGGPGASNRTTLAIATASRHPAMAIAIAAANFPNQNKLVAGAVVIYLILRIILFFPYVLWRRRSQEQHEPTQTPAAQVF